MRLDSYHDLLNIRSPGGSMSQASLGIWDFLFALQSHHNIHGNMLEIGMWHGWSAVLMMKNMTGNEKFFGIDLYFQHEKFYNNIHSVLGKNYTNVNIFEESSDSVARKGKLQAYADSFRFIHIDAEHSYDAVVRDAELSLDVANEKTIIVFDDFFNWQSVCITQAVFDILERHKHRIRMFLCAENKAYCSSVKMLDFYRSQCLRDLVDFLEAEYSEKMSLAQNGHRWEVDYLSAYRRNGASKYMTIGKYLDEKPE